MSCWALRVRAPAKTFTLSTCGPDTSFAELQGAIATELAVQPAQLTLKAGFPPAIVSLEAAEKISSKLTNQETIRVEIEGGAAKPKPKAKAKGGKAKAAPKAKATSKRKPAAPATGVHTLFGGSSTPKAKKAKSNSSASSSGGSVMTLGGPVGGRSSGGGGSSKSSASSPKRKRMKAVQLNSKDDTQNKLVAAFSSTGARDTAGQFLRAATKGAMISHLETVKANARYSAALGGNFTIEECQNIRRLGDGNSESASVEMIISFKQEQHMESEQVDAITAEEIAAVVRYIVENEGESGLENLKPFKMAAVSPRIFWSIARLYQNEGGDIITAGLQALIPEHDWSCLEKTTRRKSELAIQAEETAAIVKAQKAEAREDRERKKQERAERKAAKDKEKEEKQQAAAAKEKKKAKPASKAKSTAAAKSKGKAKSDAVKEEVLEIDDGEEDEEAVSVKSIVGQVWAAVLSAVGVGTVQMLADLDVDAVATHCTAVSAAIAAAAFASSSSSSPAAISSPDETTIEEWLQQARQEAIDDMMEEIIAISGNGEGEGGCMDPTVAQEIFLALEGICISTPRDLKLHPADLVVHELLSNGFDKAKAPTIETVQAWQERAIELLDQHEWLQGWVYQWED